MNMVILGKSGDFARVVGIVLPSHRAQTNSRYMTIEYKRRVTKSCYKYEMICFMS